MAPHILAVRLDNLLFLLLLAVAGVFQLLAKGLAKKRDDQPPSAPSATQRTKPIPRAGPQSDQERVRKLLEALGHPPASQPPPIPQRPTYRRPFVLPRMGPLGSPLPPLVTRPPHLPPEIQVPSQPPAIPIELQEKPELPAEQTFEVHESQPAPGTIAAVDIATPNQLGELARSGAARAAVDVTTLLRSPSGLRDAIIVREILGQPRGLREFELP